VRLVSAALNALFVLVAGVLFGGMVHIASLLALPHLAPNTAYTRISAMGPANAVIVLDPEDPARRLPLLDPAFVNMACRFDLSDGPLSIRVPIASDYVAAAFYRRDGVAFFSLSDQSAVGPSIEVLLHSADDENVPTTEARAGTVPIASPVLQGFVVMRAFAPNAEARIAIRDALARTSCEPAATP
jgi:uncharacterized membrane protein